MLLIILPFVCSLHLYIISYVCAQLQGTKGVIFDDVGDLFELLVVHVLKQGPLGYVLLTDALERATLQHKLLYLLIEGRNGRESSDGVVGKVDVPDAWQADHF